MGTSRLTILFDDPFWIGLYEREDDNLFFRAETTHSQTPSAGSSSARSPGTKRSTPIFWNTGGRCDSARPGQGQSICPLPKAPSGASGRPGG